MNENSDIVIIRGIKVNNAIEATLLNLQLFYVKPNETSIH